jgi:hypothetical protein
VDARHDRAAEPAPVADGDGAEVDLAHTGGRRDRLI